MSRRSVRNAAVAQDRFLATNNYPSAWQEGGMYPEELWRAQLADYELNGSDGDGEHVRNGAFHWWLRKPVPPVGADVLVKLVRLTFADPYPLMAADVRRYIRKHPGFDASVAAELERGGSDESRKADAQVAG
jgi:hypothetical protein